MLYNLIIPEDSESERLDKIISKLLQDVSRTVIQKSIKDGNTTVNNAVILDTAFRISPLDAINIKIEEAKAQPNVLPMNIPLDIVYEDEHLIVINKQANMTVHPGNGTHNDTLVNALLYHTKELSSEHEDITRPGIVHRLDKDTSGLMVVAKNNYAHRSIAEQIENRTLVRKYKAICWGVIIPHSGTISVNITRSNLDRTRMQAVKTGGKTAITHYNTTMILHEGLLSLVECKLETGRTHQIRVHLSHRGNSILGDQVYGNNSRKLLQCKPEVQKILSSLTRQALHSYYIQFTHPVSTEELKFEVDMPDDLSILLKNIQDI